MSNRLDPKDFRERWAQWIRRAHQAAQKIQDWNQRVADQNQAATIRPADPRRPVLNTPFIQGRPAPAWSSALTDHDNLHIVRAEPGIPLKIAFPDDPDSYVRGVLDTSIEVDQEGQARPTALEKTIQVVTRNQFQEEIKFPVLNAYGYQFDREGNAQTNLNFKRFDPSDPDRTGLSPSIWHADVESDWRTNIIVGQSEQVPDQTRFGLSVGQVVAFFEARVSSVPEDTEDTYFYESTASANDTAQSLLEAIARSRLGDLLSGASGSALRADNKILLTTQIPFTLQGSQGHQINTTGEDEGLDPQFLEIELRGWTVIMDNIIQNVSPGEQRASILTRFDEEAAAINANTWLQMKLNPPTIWSPEDIDTIAQSDQDVIITLNNHGYQTGNVVEIRLSDTTPTIDGFHNITRIDDNNFKFQFSPVLTVNSHSAFVVKSGAWPASGLVFMHDFDIWKAHYVAAGVLLRPEITDKWVWSDTPGEWETDGKELQYVLHSFILDTRGAPEAGQNIRPESGLVGPTTDVALWLGQGLSLHDWNRVEGGDPPDDAYIYSDFASTEGEPARINIDIKSRTAHDRTEVILKVLNDAAVEGGSPFELPSALTPGNHSIVQAFVRTKIGNHGFYSLSPTPGSTQFRSTIFVLPTGRHIARIQPYSRELTQTRVGKGAFAKIPIKDSREINTQLTTPIVGSRHHEVGLDTEAQNPSLSMGFTSWPTPGHWIEIACAGQLFYYKCVPTGSRIGAYNFEVPDGTGLSWIAFLDACTQNLYNSLVTDRNISQVLQVTLSSVEAGGERKRIHLRGLSNQPFYNIDIRELGADRETVQDSILAIVNNRYTSDKIVSLDMMSITPKGMQHPEQIEAIPGGIRIS